MNLSNIFGSNYGKDLYSTGSYGKDVGIGLLSSLGYALNQPGQYYVKANYKGNGLADTGLGYMANQNYTNPYDMMNALTSSMYGARDKSKPLIFDEMNIRLSDLISKPMFSNLTEKSRQSYPLKTETYNMPTVGDTSFGSVGDYGNAYNSWYGYNLPTQQNDFKLPWE